MTPENVRSRLAGLTPEQLRIQLVSIMFEGGVIGRHGFRDEQPEDLPIAILKFKDHPNRQTVVDGCRDLCGKLFALLNEPSAGTDERASHAASHFAALLSIARPPELARQVRGLLELALDSSVPSELRDPIVRAAVAYAEDERDAPYWLAQVQRNVIPSYAFQALLRINPKHPRLEGLLSDLWRRCLRGELNLRIPFAADRVARLQPDPEGSLRRILNGVIDGAPDLEPLLLQDCAKYALSRNWAHHLGEPDSLRVQKLLADWMYYRREWRSKGEKERSRFGSHRKLLGFWFNAARPQASEQQEFFGQWWTTNYDTALEDWFRYKVRQLDFPFPIEADENELTKIREINQPVLNNPNKWVRGVAIEYDRNNAEQAGRARTIFERLHQNLAAQSRLIKSVGTESEAA